MLFPQSPSLRALFVVVFVDDDPVSFCICWKICLKGNKNPNLGCPLRWLRVPCGCGRRGDSQLADWVAGLGTAAPRGILGLGGAAGLQFPPAFPGAQEPPGIPTPLVCGIFPCTSIGWSEADLELQELGWDRSCSLTFAAAEGSRDGGWSFELHVDFNLNHKSLDPAFIFEGRGLFLLLFCLFFFNQAAT